MTYNKDTNTMSIRVDTKTRFIVLTQRQGLCHIDLKVKQAP